MRRFLFLIGLIVLIACNNDQANQQKSNADDTETVKAKRDEVMPEGMRNRRGYPIGTVEQANQLLEGAKAKRREIARRMADLIKDPSKAQLIKEISEPMEKLRPKLDRFESITGKIVSGESVDFLSPGDLGKLQYRQQTMLDAVIDSLSYINSLFDQVLTKSDLDLMKAEDN